MLNDVHSIAMRYHWSEEVILRLSVRRRTAYLELIRAHDEQGLFDALDQRG